MRKTLLVLSIILLLTAAAGCSSTGESASLQPPRHILAARAEEDPEHVVIGVKTPEPVATATPPATPTPTPTPVPTPVPTPSPVPSPSPIPFSYYAPTVAMTFDELIGGLSDTFYEDEGGDPIEPAGYPPADTYKIIVDEYWQVVLVYTKDNTGKYTVPHRYMICSTGSKKLGLTRKGTFPLEACRIRYGKFANLKLYAQYWTLIFSRTYFHSILYTVRNDFTTLDVTAYKNLGTPQSHGCIRLTVPDARWIYYNCAYGTEVEIRQGSKSDEETKAIREQLVLPPIPDNWPYKIDLSEVPYTDNWTIEDVDTTLPFVFQTPRPPPKKKK